MKPVLHTHKSAVRKPAHSASSCLTPPLRLVVALRDNPLALGLFCLIARLYLIHKQPVPLSAADIAAYDPLASPSAIRRAVRRLVAAGGAVVTKNRGAKQRFVPAWGLVGGAARPWNPGCKLYNRPAHLDVLRFDTRIFDYFLGRLILDGRLGAAVDRYVSAPLLSLGDVGAYLVLQGGFTIKPEQMDQLGRCGLIRAGKTCDLPANGDDILRWISQHQLLRDDAPDLTEKGLRRLGVTPDEPSTAPATSSQPLAYFAPGRLSQVPPISPESFGCSCGNRSGLEREKMDVEMGHLAPSGADIPQPGLNDADMTWNLKQLTHDPTLPSQEAGFKQKKFKRTQKKTRPPLPATPTAELLRTLGAHPTAIRELCHIDIEQANKILAYGRSRPDVRSLAGWVVSALRNHRDDGWVPPALPIPCPDLFDPAKFATSPDVALFVRDETARVASDAPSGEEPAPRHHASADELAEWIRRTLHRMLRREDRALVEGLRLLDAGDSPLFGCACAEDLLRVEDGLAYAIRTVCQEFGWDQAPRFMLAADWAGHLAG